MNALYKLAITAALSLIFLSGCSTPTLPEARGNNTKEFNIDTYEYLIGPKDSLQVIVWRHEDVTGTFSVKPDGKITMPLIGDINVVGKTTREITKELELKLDTVLKEPKVTVVLKEFSGSFGEQVKVVGAATQPIALNYSKNMTLLDVMIAVGGLNKYADGNDAFLIRKIEGKRVEFDINIEDLVKDGDLSENVDILPGDVIVIPEAWF